MEGVQETWQRIHGPVDGEIGKYCGIQKARKCLNSLKKGARRVEFFLENIFSRFFKYSRNQVRGKATHFGRREEKRFIPRKSLYRRIRKQSARER